MPRSKNVYRPELVDKPAIVRGSPEKRGVVLAANYVARRHGVHSAMPAVTTHRLCPNGVICRIASIRRSRSSRLLGPPNFWWKLIRH